MTDILSKSRELGFIRGLAHAQKLAAARGQYALAAEIGRLAVEADIEILASTKIAGQQSEQVA